MSDEAQIFDVGKRSLIRDGVALRLVGNQLRLVEALARAGGTVSVGALVVAVWKDAEPDYADSSIKLIVHTVRRKATLLGWQSPIETHWGAGYSLCRPFVILNDEAPAVVIPFRFRVMLEQLLYSHPDRANADLVLGTFVTA